VSEEIFHFVFFISHLPSQTFGRREVCFETNDVGLGQQMKNFKCEMEDLRFEVLPTDKVVCPL